MILRVASVSKEAGWINAMNGTHFTLRWDKKKWEVEEMEDGSPIPTMRGFGGQSGLITHQMPILDAFVWGKFERFLGFDATTILSYAKLHGNDSGEEVRKKLIAANDAVYDAVAKQMKEEGRAYDAERLTGYMPEIRRKLKWKRVR